MANNLAARTQALYDRLKDFPEAGRVEGGTVLRKDAWLALLDLRQLLRNEIIPALEQAERDEQEWVTIPRL